MSDSSTFPLRLPKSIKAAAEKFAQDAGISLNQFVATAVAEEVEAMQTASFFDARRQRADRNAFRELLERSGGEAPREGDERPG